MQSCPVHTEQTIGHQQTWFILIIGAFQFQSYWFGNTGTLLMWLNININWENNPEKEFQWFIPIEHYSILFKTCISISSNYTSIWT